MLGSRALISTRCSRISLRSIRATDFGSGVTPNSGAPLRFRCWRRSRSRVSLRLEFHGDAVDAIAQMGRRRAVVEDVAEMAAAAVAMHLGADHAVAAIGRGFDRAVDRIVEARPAGAALELRLRHEQRLVAPGTHEGAMPLLEVQGTAPGRFGPVPAHDVVLLRS